MGSLDLAAYRCFASGLTWFGGGLVSQPAAFHMAPYEGACLF
jgi:hypothetical protein